MLSMVCSTVPLVDPHPATVNLLPVINPLLRPAVGKQIGLMYFEYETFRSSRMSAMSWCLSLDLSLYCGWTMIFSTPTSTTGSAHFRIWPFVVFDGMQSSSVSILYSPKRMAFLWIHWWRKRWFVSYSKEIIPIKLPTKWLFVHFITQSIWMDLLWEILLHFIFAVYFCLCFIN